MTSDEFTEYPIDGVLDLHHFKPSDISTLIPEYIGECIKVNIAHIRIIHGKGAGQLRRGVEALLERDARVIAFETAKDASSWGATWVTLRVGD
jgi:DNA-nicking Smr family endonuclease